MSSPSGDAVLLARAEVGRVLRGKWRLDELLGVGSITSTYAATHRGGKRVAIRVLHGWLKDDAELARSFVEDAYVANRIDHRSVVSVLDDDVTELGAPFVVLELLDGETVEARWSRSGQRLALLEVLWVADQVLDTLVAAHEKGVVHGRIRAANLFLTRQSSLKVMDFGTLRVRSRGRLPPDARADLRAVGAMMVALLAGRSSVSSGMEATAQELPTPVAQLIAAAMAHDGSEQLGTPAVRAAVRRAFEELMRGPSQRSAHDELTRPDAPAAPDLVADRAAMPLRAMKRTIQMRSSAAAAPPPRPELESFSDTLESRISDLGGHPQSPAEEAPPSSGSQPPGGGAAEHPLESTMASAAGVPVPVARRSVPELASGRPKSATGARLIFANELAYVYIQRALQREDAGDLLGAIEDYGKALERLPNHALAYYNRGTLRQATQDQRGALEDYRRAAQLAPDLADAFYNAALIEWRLGEREAAAQSCETARDLYAGRRDDAMCRQATELLDHVVRGAVPVK